ncbi:GntR family transcriptional regulator [Actinocatenispora sera]|uniref:GntR family transcriptional regulator n=2 Tax=Actinocatenispora sera TaxID=390989 RepID=A0A810KU68_9ACTN|nr:GntR family transcriptional regulator [Actinocatenispora sera]
MRAMSYGYTGDGPLADPPDALADPLAMRLAAIIREIRPGERLPAERELATRLGVSRTALRDRLRFLESAGILRRRSGSGTYVEALNPQALTRTLGVAVTFSGLPAESMFTALDALDRQAAREAATQADHAQLAALRQALEGMRDVRPNAVLTAHEEFHDAMIEAAASPALTLLRSGVVGALRKAQLVWPDRPDSADAVPPPGLYERHRAIYQAIAAGDPTAAGAAFDA